MADKYAGTDGPRLIHPASPGSEPDETIAAALGLRERPFETKPDTRYVHLGEEREATLQQLTSALVRGATMCLMLGPSGIGKSALLSKLAVKLLAESDVKLLASSTKGSPLEKFLGAGKVFEATSDPSFADFSRPSFGFPPKIVISRSVLFLDDADRLTNFAWQRLREWFAQFVEETGPLSIIASAADGDRVQSAWPEGWQSADTEIVELWPMDGAESAALIEYRLRRAGARPDAVFSPAAIERICEIGHGNPGVIVEVCRHAMDRALPEERVPIPSEIVDEAAGIEGDDAPPTLIEDDELLPPSETAPETEDADVEPTDAGQAEAPVQDASWDPDPSELDGSETDSGAIIENLPPAPRVAPIEVRVGSQPARGRGASVLRTAGVGVVLIGLAAGGYYAFEVSQEKLGIDGTQQTAARSDGATETAPDRSQPTPVAERSAEGIAAAPAPLIAGTNAAQITAPGEASNLADATPTTTDPETGRSEDISPNTTSGLPAAAEPDATPEVSAASQPLTPTDQAKSETPETPAEPSSTDALQDEDSITTEDESKAETAAPADDTPDEPLTAPSLPSAEALADAATGDQGTEDIPTIETPEARASSAESTPSPTQISEAATPDAAEVADAVEVETAAGQVPVDEVDATSPAVDASSGSEDAAATGLPEDPTAEVAAEAPASPADEPLPDQDGLQTEVALAATAGPEPGANTDPDQVSADAAATDGTPANEAAADVATADTETDAPEPQAAADSPAPSEPMTSALRDANDTVASDDNASPAEATSMDAPGAVAATPAITDVAADSPSDTTDPAATEFVAQAETSTPEIAAPATSDAPSAADAVAEPDSAAALRLIERGDGFFELGDIASARLFYRAASEQGSVTALVKLGQTYDPIVFEQLGVQGTRSAPDLAVKWYRAAVAKGGGNDPRNRLERLMSRLRAAANSGDESAKAVLGSVDQ